MLWLIETRLAFVTSKDVKTARVAELQFFYRPH